jgi:hypothetical protein
MAWSWVWHLSCIKNWFQYPYPSGTLKLWSLFTCKNRLSSKPLLNSSMYCNLTRPKLTPQTTMPHSLKNIWVKKTTKRRLAFKLQIWMATCSHNNYLQQSFQICLTAKLHATMKIVCLIHNARLGKILFFCRILDLKITHLKKNFDLYFWLTSAIVIQA